MKNENIAETMEENVETAEVIEPRLRDRVANLRPVKFVKRHVKGFAIGVGTAAAVGTAMVVAGKMAADGALETPLDLDAVTDAVPEIGVDA